MNGIFILTFILFISLCSSQPRFQIIGGKESSITQFPHQCAFLYNGKLKCGCSVISNKCFLTAGHCTYQYKTNVTVRTGSSMKESGGDVYNIRKIVNYPLFDIVKLNFDYAILMPDRDIRLDRINVRPIALPKQNQETPDDTICTVSGWGKADNDTRPDILRSVDVRMINQDLCQKSYNTSRVKFTITENMVCAGYMPGGKDACSGDSGGPLICNVDDELIQTGVVSSGYGCAVQNFPGIYSDVAQVRNWIDLYCGTK